MSKVTMIEGKAIPLIGNDIDTDRIIPARFLRCVTFDGLGEQVFKDDRTQAQGKHPFDLPQYQNANVLVVNGNFGCGSSREHAPQAIAKWGIKALLGESFAEIFFGNCVSMGIPCLTATSSTIEKLQKLLTHDPQIDIKLDLEKMLVTCGNEQLDIQMPTGTRQQFLSGTWDATGALVKPLEQIKLTASQLPYLSWAT